MAETLVGPRLSDAEFFGERVDTSLPGMEGLAQAAAAGDYALCRKIFARRVREHLRVDLYEKLGADAMSAAFARCAGLTGITYALFSPIRRNISPVIRLASSTLSRHSGAACSK